MVLWVGVDDTDSLLGMCTTFLATEIIRELIPRYDLIGYPRLVRLNPNIPWKTRGNGALCFRLGHGAGQPFQVGDVSGGPVLAYPSWKGSEDERRVLGEVLPILERHAVFDDPTTNPGVVVLRERPSPSLYWQAVRGIVSLPQALREVSGRGVLRGYKNRRGLIGSAAAVAWRPRDRTYELLAYRDPNSWGTSRFLDAGSVQSMNARFPCTFSNIDTITGHVAIAPHSPCPVLYGIRGDHVGCLPHAQAALSGERPDRWFLFETNQGTDDHIRWDDWTLQPGSATSIEGRVADPPRTIEGGHTLVPFAGEALVDLAFYEPSKDFRSMARSLRPGDVVRVWGSVRRDGRSLNVEKVYVRDLVPCRVRVANPRCPACGKSMKSIGRGKGYRCVRGHAHAPPGAVEYRETSRSVSPGWYEPPAYSRRHLAMPLKRAVRRLISPQRHGPRGLPDESSASAQARRSPDPGFASSSQGM